MDIVIPLGGKGERFVKKGYSVPKPLIYIGYKEMIRHVIDRLDIGKNDTLTILYHEQLDKHNFSGVIRKHYPYAHLVAIPFQTRGAVETIDYGLRPQQHFSFENDERRCLLLDCDAFYTENIVNMAKTRKNGVFVFQEEDVSQLAKFSYVSLNDDSTKITDIAEKSRISSFANTGAYLFENRKTLLTYTQKVIEQNFRFNNEFYTSCVIKLMLMDNHEFHAIELPKSSFVSLGTPEQVDSYLSQCHAFLFDLDGTLVDTTDIYVNVWKKLLEPYHINVDSDFFKNYIDGNNDEMVIQMLIPVLGKEERNALSHRKDALFLEFINRLKIIDGAFEFMTRVRKEGHLVGIVTNCNRTVAENIVCYCGFEKMVDVLVIGNECDRPKPHPDPYQKAKEILKQEKVVIFEDSCAGLLSASGVSNRCIVGVYSHHHKEDLLKQHGAHLVINDFTSLSIKEVLDYHTSNELSGLEKKIMESVSGRFVGLERVEVLSNKLKGGYIADVLRVDLHLKGGDKIECVAKLQSDKVSNLSDMATELGLYKREQYFYEVIRDHIQIKAPRYFGTIRENMKPCGILLEYLPPASFRLDIDLEKEPLDIVLGVVKKIASHHARFWDKDLINTFPQLTKNDDPAFCPLWGDYVKTKWPLFKEKWNTILKPRQLEMGEKVVGSFNSIQKHLSKDPLTLCHGDVKSPNIFFNHQYEPYFIDWQYIIAGKGTQDLVFLMIESFSQKHISRIGNTLKEYYYLSLLEQGVANYNKEAYETDFQISICYFPFFVAMWFGTTPTDQLIDINFPFFFIQKLFSFMEKFLDTKTLMSIQQ